MSKRSLNLKNEPAIGAFGRSVWRRAGVGANNNHPLRNNGHELPAEQFRGGLGETQLLKRTIERRHGGVATHVKAVTIRETIEDRGFCDEIVHVFELSGHPGAIRAYAWHSSGTDGGPRQVFTVLHAPQVSSPRKAVRAAFLTDLVSK